MITSRIVGTGSYVPEQIVTNDDLAKIVDTNDEWIRTRTGIRQRRLVTAEGTSQMAARAARKALEQSGVKPEEIELIILGTSSQDYCFPSGACEVQAMIGAVNAVCYDLSAACTGFVYALNTAHAFIKAGIYRTALIIGSDVLSKLIDWSDRSTCVLFGDGAGAAVVKADETGVLGMRMYSDGTKGDVLTCGARTNGNFLLGKKPELGYMTMNGQEVFKFAVKKVPEVIRQVLEDTQTPMEEIRYFVLHQANMRIIESVAKRLKADPEKFYKNMDRHGNTSAASIPVALNELAEAGRLIPGQTVACLGFGAGLTWGGMLFQYKGTNK